VSGKGRQQSQKKFRVDEPALSDEPSLIRDKDLHELPLRGSGSRLEGKMNLG
jgi:hypothetical protein